MHGGLLFQFILLARFRNDDIVPTFLAQLPFIELLGFQIAMHDEGLLYLAWVLATQVMDHLLIVSMATESINFIDFSFNCMLQTEDRNTGRCR